MRCSLEIINWANLVFMQVLNFKPMIIYESRFFLSVEVNTNTNTNNETNIYTPCPNGRY